jgi:valyl-tRNA synthetase
MPFKDVYIHGLVRDENGKKMSKSANNGIDPLILIDKYGTDALRYTLIREVAGAGQDISLQYNRQTDESESVEASRNFANKLWNASRFVLMNLDGKTPRELGFSGAEKLELCDRWILSRFNQVVQQTRDQINEYGLGEAAKGLYEFIWGDFCDWYIELVKSRLNREKSDPSRLVAQQTLAFVLEGILKLLHPFMPHITEEIWHIFRQKTGQVLALQAYPEVKQAMIDSDLEQSFSLLFSTIRTIRNLRTEAEIKPGVKTGVILQSENSQEREILTATELYIQDLGKVAQLTITPQLSEDNRQVIAGVVGTVQILIPLTGIVDLEGLRAKLQKKLTKLAGEIKSLVGRLNNPGFVNKAPEDVIQTARDALTEAEKQAEILRERLKRLQ